MPRCAPSPRRKTVPGRWRCTGSWREFGRYSGVNFVEFTKPGSCARLQELLGKAPGEKWTEDERREFFHAFYYFRRACEAVGGENIAAAAGDAH